MLPGTTAHPNNKGTLWDAVYILGDFKRSCGSQGLGVLSKQPCTQMHPQLFRLRFLTSREEQSLYSGS